MSARKLTVSKCLLRFVLPLALAGSLPAQTPDVIVYDVGVNGGDTNDIHYYGQSSGIAAYSIATQSCNSGTAQLLWIDSGGSTQHPVIAQNMFRYRDGRFEHVGQSWLKHGFCAVNEIEAQCAPCQSTNCDTLGIGCADTYWAQLNDGGGGQSKRHVNAATGTHVHGGSPTGNATIRGRLQVAVTDIDPAQNPGAEWFIEGQYVTADDSAAGVSENNASWRRVSVVAVNNVNGGGPTMREEPAIFAWKSVDPAVEIQNVPNVESAGAKTVFFLGFRVTDLGGGRWSYEYALQNLNSDQGASSFSVPVESKSLVTDIGFHDVNYHSGDPYDGTDWPGLKADGEIRWATTPFATNVNANALRWGTLYNFRFVANTPPVRGPVTIGLFKPAVATEITVDDVWVPMGPPMGKVRPNPTPPLGGGSVSLPLTASRPGTRTVPVLVGATPAVIGGTWEAALDVAGVERSLLFVSFGGAAEGRLTRHGQILLAAPAQRLPEGTLSLSIPNDAKLIGTSFSAQAALLTDEGWRLTNALDVTIGGAK